MNKTNALRFVETSGVQHQTRLYQVSEDDLSAKTVAEKIGLSLEQVYKTLCCKGDKSGYLFAVVAGDLELDLKALAAASNNRKCETLSMKSLSQITGYHRGAVTVFSAKKKFPVFVDECVLMHDLISVSGGKRGLQILLSPEDYLHLSEGKVANFSREKKKKPPFRGGF